MFKPIRRLISAGSLLLLTGLLVLLARLLPEFWFSFYTDFSRGALRAIGAVTGVLPFCLWEILLAGLVIWLIVSLVLAIRRRRMAAWATGVLEGAALIVFLFMGLWGLNHFAPDIGRQIGREKREYSVSELKKATAYYIEQASLASTQIERDENGDPVIPDFSVMARQAEDCYAVLGEEFPRLDGPAGRIKPLIASEAFAYMGTTGIFLCITAEPTVSTFDFPLDQPYTMCHELGHGLAVAGEDEANYCAFLACRASEDPLFRYSGYYSAFIYCYNALYDEDPAAAQKLWELASEELKHDCDVHVSYNKQYEGPAQDVVEATNNTYLKAMGREGVKSYGLVVDYLIEEYLLANPG